MTTALSIGTPASIPFTSVKITKTVVTLPTAWTAAGLAFTAANLGFTSQVLRVFPVYKSGYVFNAVNSSAGDQPNTLLAYRHAGSSATGVVAGPLVAVSDSVDLSVTPGTITVVAIGY